MKIITLIPSKESISGEIEIAGSKSYTNRALLLAAITPHPVTILHPLYSDDTEAMINCLRELGIAIETEKTFIKVVGSILDVKEGEYKLNARLSGTTIRFILALTALVPGVKILEGESGLNKRPIGPLVDALRQLGGKIEYMKEEGYPPLRIVSSKLNPGTFVINGEISSQYISALLMILPGLSNTKIEIQGEQISKPYIDMTIDTIKAFGAEIQNEKYQKYALASGASYSAKEYSVEGDFSSAGYFFAIAALTKSTITVRNLNPESLQPDKKLLNVLESMGNVVRYEKKGVTLEGKGVNPVSVDMEDFPDQAQTLAVLAAFAKGPSVLSGLSSLRVKETDRLHAIMNELKSMGIRTELNNFTLTIHGGDPKPARIKTYGDHRMAMAFAVAGSKIPGMEIEDPEVVGKTNPQFWEMLASLGIGVQDIGRNNIILIGMRGSGKSNVLPILAKKLNMKCIDADDSIAEDAGMSIPEIVQKEGWEGFRDREAKVIRELSSLRDTVIATGGGAVLRAENVASLKESGVFVFLDASLEVLTKRNSMSLKPRLTQEETVEQEIGKVLNERLPLYRNSADVTIDVGERDAEDIAEETIAKLGKKVIH